MATATTAAGDLFAFQMQARQIQRESFRISAPLRVRVTDPKTFATGVKTGVVFLSRQAVNSQEFVQQLSDLLLPCDLSELGVLYLDGSTITDAGVLALSKIPFKDCHKLKLSATKITDKAVVSIVKSKAMRETLSFLSLADTAITDKGARFLCLLSGLMDLDLSGTDITDQGTKFLSRLPRLASLKLSGTDIGDQTIERLVGGTCMPKKDADTIIKIVTMNVRRGEDFGKDTIKLLKERFPIRFLHLCGTQVTPSGFEKLLDLPNLESLFLDTKQMEAMSAAVQAAFADKGCDLVVSSKWCHL